MPFKPKSSVLPNALGLSCSVSFSIEPWVYNSGADQVFFSMIGFSLSTLILSKSAQSKLERLPNYCMQLISKLPGCFCRGEGQYNNSKASTPLDK